MANRLIRIEPFIREGAVPCDSYHLKAGQKWLVRMQPMGVSEGPNGEPGWALVQKGDVLRIPLVPYRMKPDPRAVVGGIGDLMGAMATEVGIDHNIRETIFVTGDPVEEIPDEGVLRAWVGFAARIK